MDGVWWGEVKCGVPLVSMLPVDRNGHWHMSRAVSVQTNRCKVVKELVTRIGRLSMQADSKSMLPGMGKRLVTRTKRKEQNIYW